MTLFFPAGFSYIRLQVWLTSSQRKCPAHENAINITHPDKKMDNLVLYGQNIKPIQLHVAGHVTMIAYFLYPHIRKHCLQQMPKH